MSSPGIVTTSRAPRRPPVLYVGLAAILSICARLWVPETLHTSRDLLIFVEESTEPVASADVADLGCGALGERS